MSCFRCLRKKVTGPTRRISALPTKIKSDLVAAQLTGACYWPFIDIISSLCIPVAYIPLFINFAIYIWIVILSIKSKRTKQKAAFKMHAD